jgi:hypothetical protein
MSVSSKLLVTNLARGAYHLSNLTVLDSTIKFAVIHQNTNNAFIISTMTNTHLITGADFEAKLLE